MKIVHNPEKSEVIVSRWGRKHEVSIMLEVSKFIPKSHESQPFVVFPGIEGEWFWLSTSNPLNEGDPNKSRDYFSWDLQKDIVLIEEKEAYTFLESLPGTVSSYMDESLKDWEMKTVKESKAENKEEGIEK